MKGLMIHGWLREKGNGFPLSNPSEFIKISYTTFFSHSDHLVKDIVLDKSMKTKLVERGD